MRIFRIYHAVDPTFISALNQERELVGTVTAATIEGAYTASQNLTSNWNPLNPCRSTSIGDMIQDEDDVCYVVSGIGFIELPEND
jgi:hypothetical protein